MFKFFFNSFFLFFFIGFSSLYALSFDTYLFKNSVERVQAYDQFVYGVFNRGLLKFDFHSNKVSQIPYDTSFSYQVHFNRLFIVGKKELLSYDARYSNLQWMINDLSIHSLFPVFPYLYFMDKNGYLGCLDFLSGDVLWRFSKFKSAGFRPLGHSLYLVLIQGRYLRLLNRLDGSVVLKKDLQLNDMVIQTTWNRGVCLSYQDQLYIYRYPKKQLTLLDQRLVDGGQWINETGYLFFDPSANQICFFFC